MAQAAGGLARGLRRGGPAVPPDRGAPDRACCPGTTPRSVSSPTSRPTRSCGSAAGRRRAGRRAGRPRGAAVGRVVDAVVAGPGRRHGQGLRAHLHPRGPARLRAGSRALAGRHGGGQRPDAAGGGLRRDGPRRRAGAALHPDPQLRHRRPRPRARDDAAPAGPPRPVRRRRPHRHHLRRLDADLHAHALDPRPQPGRAAAARVRREEADARHRPALRPGGPGHGGAGRAGRPQPHRLRRPDARCAVRHQRPAGRRAPAAPEGVGVRGHHQGGDRDLRARRADRGATRAAWCAAPAEPGRLRTARPTPPPRAGRGPRHGRLHPVWRRP